MFGDCLRFEDYCLVLFELFGYDRGRSSFWEKQAAFCFCLQT